MRRVVRLFLWVPIFFFMSLVFTGGGFEESEMRRMDYIFVQSWEGNQIEIFLNGETKRYVCDEYAKEEKRDIIADLVMRGERVLHVKEKEEKILGTITEIKKHSVYVKNLGEILLQDHCKAYRKEGENVLYEIPKEQLLGEKNVTVFLEKNRAVALFCLGKQQERELRIAIGRAKTSSMFHQKLVVTSDSAFFQVVGETSKKYKKGQKLILDESDFIGEEYFEIKSKGEGKLKIQTLKKKEKIDLGEYPGKIEVHFEKGRGIVLIHPVTLEEYVEEVSVAERMDETLETAKVKAVCVRTEAARAWYEPAIAKYGVHIGDEKDQYKKENANKLYKKAVRETEGEIIRWRGEPIRTNIYLISAGTTSDAKDVWIKERRNYFYLKGHLQNREKHWKDLSKEEDFLNFIRNKNKKDFEYGERYYRWWVNLEFEKLSEHINKKLEEYIEREPEAISVVREQKIGEKRRIKTLGRVEEVTVLERSKGGIVKVCEIKGEKNTIRVRGQKMIRKLLFPERTIIFLEDGESDMRESLPSAYFAVEKAYGGIRLIGGGCGEGVGVSEVGALALAGERWNYKDILGYYFLLDIK